jgi:hypothetical protein
MFKYPFVELLVCSVQLKKITIIIQFAVNLEMMQVDFKLNSKAIIILFFLSNPDKSIKLKSSEKCVTFLI